MILIIIYFTINLLIGLFSKPSNNINNYFFGSRKITIIPFVATIVTTWYGGILTIGDHTVKYGISTWVIFGLFYYLAALIFSFYFVPKIHKYNISSIPFFFNKRLGRNAGFVSAILMLLISSPAPYIIILCIILKHIFSIPLILSLIISLIYSTTYIYFGGYKSIIRTDKLQFILMYLGFFLILYKIFCSSHNDILSIVNEIPAYKLKIDWYATLPWMIIALTTFIDPNIIQRTYSGKDVSSVKKGFLISILFWILFDFLTISIGLIATTSEFNLSGNGIYLQIADIVLNDNYYLKQIFYISLLATVMSSIDSYSFTSSMTIGKDIIPIFRQKTNPIISTKKSIIITSLLSSALIYITGYDNMNFVIDFWWFFGCLGGCCLIIPYIILLNNYEIKLPLITIIIPGAIFVLLNFTESFRFNLNPSSIYIGLLSSIILNILFSRKSGN